MSHFRRPWQGPAAPWLACGGFALVALAARVVVARSSGSNESALLLLLLLLALGGAGVVLQMRTRIEASAFWAAAVLALIVTVGVVVSDTLRFVPGFAPLWARSDPARHSIYAVLLCTFWCFGFLIARFRQTSLDFSAVAAIRQALSIERDAGSRAAFESLVQRRGVADSVLVKRRVDVLNAYGPSAQWVERRVREQASLDASALETSYTPARALIWSLPALGFIGTASAMASSIGGVGAALNAAASSQAQLALLTQVVPHLANAFGLTLTALTASVLCHFATSLVHQRDERALNEVDTLLLDLVGQVLLDTPSVSAPVFSERILVELWSLERQLMRVSGVLEQVMEGRGYSETLSELLLAIGLELNTANQRHGPDGASGHTWDGLESDGPGGRVGALLQDILQELRLLSGRVAPRTSGVGVSATGE